MLGGGGSLGAVQVGMLQALGERDIPPDIVAGTSVGSLNGSVLAMDPKSAANRLSHLWAKMTRDRVFPGGLLSQARTLQHTRTHLFPSTGLVPVVYLHGPEPLRISPLDFRQTGPLIETAYEAARSFLDRLHVDGPGLYGSP